MNKEKVFTKTFPIILFSFILFCFSACSLKAEQKSLTSQFETQEIMGFNIKNVAAEIDA